MNGDSGRAYIQEFIDARPGFVVVAENETTTILEGDYPLFAEHGGVLLAEDYRLRIEVPSDYPISIPSVFEVSNLIPSSYEHSYENGALCLGVDGEIAASLANDGSMTRFMESYVRDALYSAKYYHRFGKYPFDDREHGAAGILSYYAELFEVGDLEAFELLSNLADDNYRGHLACPCGSGLRTKECHGPAMLDIIHSPSRKLAAANDFKRICNELESIQRRKAEIQKVLAPLKEWRDDLRHRMRDLLN